MSNFQPNFFGLKVRHDFHFLAHFMTTEHFWCMRDSNDFHPLHRIPCS